MASRPEGARGRLPHTSWGCRLGGDGSARTPVPLVGPEVRPALAQGHLRNLKFFKTKPKAVPRTTQLGKAHLSPGSHGKRLAGAVTERLGEAVWDKPVGSKTQARGEFCLLLPWKRSLLFPLEWTPSGEPSAWPIPGEHHPVCCHHPQEAGVWGRLETLLA